MDVGVFFPVEPEHRSAGKNLSMLVEMARTCEQLGFASVWIASRHLSESYAAVPSPLVLLAAAASVTQTIRLGTSIVTLPLEDPIRLSEDFATLDALSGGRARLGVGSGDDPPAFKAFGSDFDQRQAETSARMNRLLEVLEGADLDGTRLYPAVEDVKSKVALGAQSARGAAWAASLGVGLLQGRSEPKTREPTATQARAAGAYREIYPTGRVITARNVWIGASEDPLLTEALARYDSYLRSRGREPLSASREEAISKMNILFGTAEQIAIELPARLSPISPDEVLLTVDPGGLAEQEITDRLEQLSQAFGLG